MPYLEIKGVGLMNYAEGNLEHVKEMERRIRAGEAVDKIPVSIQRAIATLTKALKEDLGYRQSWIANIAMAMHDESVAEYRNGVLPHEWHDIFNKGAERFLELLCKN